MAMSNEQFQQLLSTITANKRGTFASCTFTYDGKKNSDAVEAFLAAATVFKSTEKISDSDALQSLPLLLRDEAAVWWQGVKTGVTQWEDFCTKLRHTFARENRHSWCTTKLHMKSRRRTLRQKRLSQERGPCSRWLLLQHLPSHSRLI
ncbi:hypothetical protein HW555_011798 [Spodoptera exigua]|uniref:Activity-regulated cytoskeleton associated protein 2 n=1 Tax=Spodoptera exigua TaxID=7107 RepID=A0A835G6E6_SPOEX|nr:hypothetical protein HW555_011798 [Spodoptera exigua]